MNLIVCVDERWGIGKNNGLLFSLPADMRFFKEKTSGKTVVMGYNTLLSFPASKPLKNRKNIVLAPEGVLRDDCTVCHTLEETFSEIKKERDENVFIIGGAMFYKTMYPYCTKAYITHVFLDGGATVFFDDLDSLSNWSKKPISDYLEENGLKFRFYEYTNNAPLKF